MGQYLDSLVRAATDAFEKRKRDFILTDQLGRWDDRIYDLRQAAHDAVSAFVHSAKKSERGQKIAEVIHEVRADPAYPVDSVSLLSEARALPDKARLVIEVVVARMRENRELVDAEAERISALMDLASEHEFIDDGSNPTELLREYFNRKLHHSA